MSLDFKKTESVSIEEPRIVPLFHSYIAHEFGEEHWEKYMENNRFNETIVELEPRYGDSVFSILVDIAVELDKTTHVKILRDFSNFVNSYY